MNEQRGRLTVGADPEMFCIKEGKLIAVQNTNIIGTKKNPQKLPNGGNAQRDNVAVEFGMEPAMSEDAFVHNIAVTIADLQEVLPDDISLVATPSAIFDYDQLRTEEAHLFGCEPDYNAWTMEINPPVDRSLIDSRLRSCGGHLHWGYVEGSGNDFLKDYEGKGLTVRVADAILGILSTTLDYSPEAIQRRQLYGKAGCFRPTEYGVEYRTLSNFWVTSPKLVRLMFRLSADLMSVMRQGLGQSLINMMGGDDIQRIILEGDRWTAMDMVGQYTMDAMSQESLLLYDECLNEGAQYNFNQEWRRAA